MDAIRGGFLLIAGNAGSETSKDHPVTEDYTEGRPSALFFWRPESGEAIPLGLFPRFQKGKEEGILVLSNEPSAPAEFLVIYDSISGGGAKRFAVTIPEELPATD